uniref:FLYWCH-type domain-containing protein n=1 Tax=Ditylenchus dipsaci TaxID=166011 RepID=A0A915ECL2_9BILA
MKRHLILSEKGKEMLDFPEGFLHWRKNSRGKRIYWRCIYYEAGKNGERSCKCPGRAVTVDGQPKITSAHNHLSDKNQSELKRFQCKVQQEAMLTKDKPRAIISTLLTSVKAEARPAIRLSVVGRTIRKRRNIANVEPANPKSLREFLLPSHTFTINNENCLKYDGWNREERILIVSTNRCLDLLVAIPKWGCDATYEVVPLLFGQLWIIYARLAHTYAPMVFALMNRCFSENKHSACFFHFRQSLIRNICSKNKVLYESDDEFCNWTNLIAALAFVPVKDVSEAFEIIRDLAKKRVMRKYGNSGKGFFRRSKIWFHIAHHRGHKLFDVNILTFNEDIGWTLYTPDVETGPSPELLQDAEKPTFALSYNGSHFDVILEI